MQVPSPMSEETLGKVMLAVLAFATMAGLALFVLTYSGTASPLQSGHIRSPVIGSR